MENFVFENSTHTFLSLAAANGVHPTVMQKLAGHKSATTTMEFHNAQGVQTPCTFVCAHNWHTAVDVHEKRYIMAKTLVAYFSASGTTAKVAADLAAATEADLFEIAPAQPYSSADLNWNNSASRSSVEMNDESCRPAISGTVANMADYEVVFVGFPVWWYVEPRIIDTFLEAYDFAGKTVVPFATSGGSGLGRAPQRMQAIAPGAKVLAGGMLNGRPSQAELASWAQGVLGA